MFLQHVVIIIIWKKILNLIAKICLQICDELTKITSQMCITRRFGCYVPTIINMSMGGATDFKVGVQKRIRERSERKKNFCTPTFPNVGVQASKYQ